MTINSHDKEIFDIIRNELERQQNSIELIASENIVSEEVLAAAGSILTNKYAEGYPGKRYYGGCEFVDEIETLAIERAKKLFNCVYANVQPHSGSQANQAVMLSFLKPGDQYLALSLAHGGHLTHGATPNMSGKWFKPIHYSVKKDTGLIDYDEMRNLALEHKPKVIITGGSAYSREIDFEFFRKVADEIGAIFWVDMAHISGLVAAGEHPSPLDFADVVTSTTHKTLRGPRGGIILSNNEEIGKKINKAIFPGLQGGPLMHIIAAKAVAFQEALRPEFKLYIQKVKENAKVLAKTLKDRGYDILTGGTDTHLILVDLRAKGLKGDTTEKSLERAGLACNKNSIPFDTEGPNVTSGLRFGSPAATTRGFGKEEFIKTGNLIADILDAHANDNSDVDAVERKVLDEVRLLCSKFPIYQNEYIK